MIIYKLIISKKNLSILSYSGALTCSTRLEPENPLLDAYTKQQKDMYFLKHEDATKAAEEIYSALRTLIGFMPDIEVNLKQIEVKE